MSDFVTTNSSTKKLIEIYLANFDYNEKHHSNPDELFTHVYPALIVEMQTRVKKFITKKTTS